MSKVTSVEVKKTGSGAKGPWTLYNITVDDNPSKFISGFAKVDVGDEVVLEEKTIEKDGNTYVNLNYSKPKAPTTHASAPSASTGGGVEDKRILKLLTIIAEEVGIEKNVIMDILTGE